MIKRLFALLCAALLGILSGSHALADDFDWRTAYSSSYADDSQTGEEVGESAEGTTETGTFVSDNGFYSLYVIESTGNVYLNDKTGSTVWRSSPENAAKDELAGGVFLSSLSSLVTLQVVDLESKSTEIITSSSDSAKEGGTVCSIKSGKVTVTYRFPKQKITVPVTLQLNNNGLKASIDVKKISEKGQYIIEYINLLPYFGAGGKEENGFMLIPDGCGAIIHFNNGKNGSASYNQPVYGGDLSETTSGSLARAQQIYLPVFGLEKEKLGYLAIVEGGTANSYIRAEVSGGQTSFNAVNASFKMRTSRTVTIGENSVTDFEKNLKDTGTLAVSYQFYNDGGGYSKMARLYREYLKNTGDFSTGVSVDLSLEIMCSYPKTKSFLGFSYRKAETLTTFAEAQNILKELSAAGVKPSLFMLSGWGKNEENGTVTTSAAFLSTLGGKKEYNKLASYSKEQGINTVLSSNLLSYQKGSGLFPSLLMDARDFNNVSVKQYQYALSTGQKTSDTPLKFLRPSKLSAAVSKLLQKFTVKGINGISASDLTQNLYADYRKDDPCSANDTLEKSIKALKTLKDGGLLLTSDSGANSYALPYLSAIPELPVSDSDYDITDYEVPFYQIAVSGLVGYTVPAVNLSSDSDRMFLKALETGSGVSFLLAERGIEPLNGNLYSKYYSIGYSQWAEKMAKEYAIVKERATLTAKSAVYSHERISDAITKTQYENGAMVFVNYGDTEYASPYGTVPARSYLFVKGGSGE